MAEQAGQFGLGTSGIDVSNFTGDGFMLTCDDRHAAIAVVNRVCYKTLCKLRRSALQVGVASEYADALHIRAAVTHGQVFPAEIPVTRPCDATSLAALQRDPQAAQQFVEEGKGVPMQKHVRLRAHFGRAVNCAFRLLDTCPARCRYRVLIHESAWPALELNEDSNRIVWPVRDFGEQIFYGVRRRSQHQAPPCSECSELKEEQAKQSRSTRRSRPCSSC